MGTSARDEARWGEHIPRFRRLEPMNLNPQLHCMSIRIILGLILMVFSTGCFMPASVANRYNQRQADALHAAAAEEWDRLDNVLASDGWHPAADPIAGALQERYDESDVLDIPVPTPGTYAMVGFCDATCLDMDLEVFSGGRRVAADFEPDDRPMAAFQGNAGERVTVRVTIPSCRRPDPVPGLNEEPLWACAYFARLYVR